MKLNGRDLITLGLGTLINLVVFSLFAGLGLGLFWWTIGPSLHPVASMLITLVIVVLSLFFMGKVHLIVLEHLNRAHKS